MEHHRAGGAQLLHERADVGADLLDLRAVAGGGDHVVGFDPAHALGVVDAGAGLHRAEGVRHLRDRLLRKHARAAGDLQAVLAHDIPGAEDDVLHGGERHELVDLHGAVVGALAEADGAHLRERADRRGLAAAGELHAGDQRGGDGAEAGHQDGETPFGAANSERAHVFGLRVGASEAELRLPDSSTL